MRTAIELKAARSDQAVPDEQFVSTLFAQLSEDQLHGVKITTPTGAVLASAVFSG